MFDMVLGLAGAALGLLLFAAGRYTADPGRTAKLRRADAYRENPLRGPEADSDRPAAPLQKEDWQALYHFLHYDGGDMPPVDEETGKDG